jgi:hypothetical protein
MLFLIVQVMGGIFFLLSGMAVRIAVLLVKFCAKASGMD